jgi:cytochrome c556
MRAVLLAMVELVCAVSICSASAGCTEPRSTACKEVCKREAECVDATGNKLPFDEKECIAACAALEHDVEHSAAKVARHIDCVTKQQACPAVLECK